MQKIILNLIGKIEVREQETVIKLETKYLPAMIGLEGFAYLQIIWWFDECDNETVRNQLIKPKPYQKAPDTLGVFATRSPSRPNPLALSCALVTYLNPEKGEIGLAYLDAHDGTPVLDIKPYTPSLDRVENPAVPDWCSHWPKCTEDSGDFDWASEFNF